MHVDPRGKKWYSLFSSDKNVDGVYLTRDYPRSKLHDKLVVQAETRTGRKFAVFDNYIDFNKYQRLIDEQYRCFFETVLGEYPQKAKFDLDIKPIIIDGNIINLNDMINHEKIKDNLIISILKVLTENSIYFEIEKDILLFTSHSKETYAGDVSEAINSNSKRSYHVIIDNLCHSNNLEAEAFCFMVQSCMDENWAKYLDTTVYKSLQQFRILGSQKKGSGRVKKFCEQWKLQETLIEYHYKQELKDVIDKELYQLNAAMISNCGYCRYFPIFRSTINPGIGIKRNYDNIEDIPEESARNALNVLAKSANITVLDPIFPYRLRKINGNLLDLKRIRPSRCIICERIHDNIDPFIIIKNSNEVHYGCRRANNATKLVGTILSPINPLQDTVTDVTDVTDVNKEINIKDEINAKDDGKHLLEGPNKIKGVKTVKRQFDKVDVLKNFNKSKLIINPNMDHLDYIARISQDDF